MTGDQTRARRLKADPAAGDCLEWDPVTLRWRPAPRPHLSGALLIGFGLVVLIYFAAELLRAVL